MKTPLRPAKRDQPHPMVTVAGLLILFALLAVNLKTRLLPTAVIIPVAISFVLVFRWASGRSARALRERREQELERLRRTPVLGLNE
jgi:hypothetical protein